MAQACGMIPASPLLRSRMKSRTTFSTMTSPHISSGSVRTSSTLVSPSVCLFSMRTGPRWSPLNVRKPVIAVSHLPMRPAQSRRYSTPTGVRSYLRAPTSRLSTCSTRLLRGEICKTNSPKGQRTQKFAVVSRIPTVDSTYYPIPYYAALFKGKWYNIKQLIGIAKEAKFKNHAPIK